MRARLVPDLTPPPTPLTEPPNGFAPQQQGCFATAFPSDFTPQQAARIPEEGGRGGARRGTAASSSGGIVDAPLNRKGGALHCMTKRKEKGGLAALCGVNRGTHTQLIAYHTIGAWGTGSDDVGLIQSTKAPNPKPKTRKKKEDGGELSSHQTTLPPSPHKTLNLKP